MQTTDFNHMNDEELLQYKKTLEDKVSKYKNLQLAKKVSL